MSSIYVLCPCFLFLYVSIYPLTEWGKNIYNNAVSYEVRQINVTKIMCVNDAGDVKVQRSAGADAGIRHVYFTDADGKTLTSLQMLSLYLS